MIINNLFFKAYFIRVVEEFIANKVKNGQMQLPIHLSIGQEIASVAICESLNQDDFLWGTYRSHALYLSRTMDLKGLFSEILGRESGCSSGRGGSMHLFSLDKKILGTSGIVGSHIPNAVGFAYASKLKDKKGITCVVFGDGATDAGTFYDSINIALLRKAPILFLLEDNDLAIRTNGKIRQFNKDILNKVKSFGMNVTESGSTLELIVKDIIRIRERIIETGFPEFIKINTVRWYQHLGFEYELDKPYRNFNLEERIKNDDEINKWLKEHSNDEINSFRRLIDDEISTAWDYAQKSPFPNPLSIFDHTR